MIEFTFRNVVESVRTGQTMRLPTNVAAKPGDIFMLVSAHPHGIHNVVEQQADENPIRAVIEVSKVEDGPGDFKHFLRWDRLVFGEATPSYQAEIAFDRAGNPRYSRAVAINKRPDENAREVMVIDLEDGELLTTDFERLTRTDRSDSGIANAEHP